MFIKIEFEMRDWKDLSWEEIQKKVVEYAEENFPKSFLMDQGYHYFDQRTSCTEFFKSSEFYVNRDIDDLTNVLEIRNKPGDQQVLYGRVFADVGRKGVLSRFSRTLDDKRIA